MACCILFSLRVTRAFSSHTLDWRPDAGLFAVPMRPQSPSGDSMQSIASSNQTRPRRDSIASGSKLTWDRPSEHTVKVKSEPIYDIPIPPPYHRGVEDVIDVDSLAPSQSSKETSPRIWRRDRYKSTSDASPTKMSYQRTDGQTLQRELSDIRRRMDAEVMRERAILAELRALGVDDTASDVDIASDTAVRVRLLRVEAQLAEERSRRKEAERFADDVRRECRAPFVVPALLDAFAEISKLTNETL
ncbi:hypothetical protein C8F01DRAFT_498692 [Mycena amicta]|nr:hypothetical protein C8F01DRAFT_498692 [Mycena amicta]